jgi:ketosteroid isomerase-like protein
MSQENVEIVRRNFEVVNSIGTTSSSKFVDPEDLAPDLWARLAPDFELHQRRDVPDAKVFRGRDESKEFWRMIQQVFAEIRWEPTEIIDLGEAVVVTSRIVATGRGSEAPVELDEVDVFWFRDGMLTRLQAFSTKDEALEAARLSEHANRPG